MNRDIKFRAKDRVTGQWVCGFPYYSSLGNWFILTETNKYHVMEETLGQFTGLKDKDGREIYEGDIVNYCDENGKTRQGRIIYDTDFCSFCVFNPREVPVHLNVFFDFTILGSIYDSKELPKQ
ncbi:MAG: YopX family protein [Muribaculaceae bacterium]|nr:YopX family protein [Muribaculaceae bacterium]